MGMEIIHESTWEYPWIDELRGQVPQSRYPTCAENSPGGMKKDKYRNITSIYVADS
jgi:hypothetical protein